MRGKLEKHGNYELFKTTHGHQILNLEDKEWAAFTLVLWLMGSKSIANIFTD